MCLLFIKYKGEYIQNSKMSGQQPTNEAEKSGQEEGGKSSDQIMKEQEEQMMSKYGGIKPKKKGLLAQNKEHKFFDSADWALNKEAAAKKGMPAPRQVPEEQLKPKLEPTAVPGRRISHLDSMEHKGDPLEHKGSEGAQ